MSLATEPGLGSELELEWEWEWVFELEWGQWWDLNPGPGKTSGSSCKECHQRGPQDPPGLFGQSPGR
jgi:hypothetical protein